MKNNVFLKEMRVFDYERKNYPFNLPLFQNDEFRLSFKKAVTIFYGDNGIGKSTILKGIAEANGFSSLGGAKNHNLSGHSSIFGKSIRLSWLPKVTSGFYFRADKLSDISAYLDGIAQSSGGGSVYNGLNGRSLETQSHGEAVFALIAKYTTTSQKNFVILDEPESSLSVASQINLVHEIIRLSSKNTQFIISTHSPVILSTPKADIMHVTSNQIVHEEVNRTTPYLLMRQIIKKSHSFFEENEFDDAI